MPENKAKGPGASATAETRIDAPWLADPGLRAVLAALTAEGAKARYVGGCVRNALLGPKAPPGTDIDIAIDRPPDETLRLLEAAGLKAIPTGFEHGTITALTPKSGEGHGTPVEVTSLRRDVETDGRRAVVAYTQDWAEDAGRRDFTMNALYADGDGLVFDPLGGGVADLAAGRLRFIGRAEDRIREDYLRILRYFRFFAWYGAEGGLAPEDLNAAKRLAPGLDGLARERVGSETRKIFSAPDPSAATRAMAEAGVLSHALPAFALSPDEVEERMRRLVEAERAAGLPPRWTRRAAAVLGAGLGADTNPDALTDALRLSRADAGALAALASARNLSPAEAAYRLDAETATDAAALLAAKDGATIPNETLAAIAKGSAAVMPIAASDLIDAGFRPGPRLGEAMRAAESEWIESGFAVDAGTLIASARSRMRNGGGAGD